MKCPTEEEIRSRFVGSPLSAIRLLQDYISWQNWDIKELEAQLTLEKKITDAAIRPDIHNAVKKQLAAAQERLREAEECFEALGAFNPEILELSKIKEWLAKGER